MERNISTINGINATAAHAGREQELLRANNLDEDIFATPAIGRNRIFIRTVGALYSFGVLDDKRVTAQQERVVGGTTPINRE